MIRLIDLSYKKIFEFINSYNPHFNCWFDSKIETNIDDVKKTHYVIAIDRLSYVFFNTDRIIPDILDFCQYYNCYLAIDDINLDEMSHDNFKPDSATLYIITRSYDVFVMASLMFHYQNA